MSADPAGSQMLGDEPGGRGRGDRRPTGVRGDDGPDHVLGGRVLEEESVGLLGQGGEHRGVVVEGRQHDHGGARVLFLDPGQQFETVHAGHAHVRDEDIDGNPFQEGEEVAGRGEGAQHLDPGRGAQV